MKWLSERIQGIRLSPIREVMAKVEAAKQKGVSVTSFSVGRPDFDTPDHIKAAAKKALDQGHVHYTASPGIQGLRDAVSRRLEEDFELNFKPSEVIITNGANFLGALQIDGIDPTKLISNDVVEIFNVLGIDAARNALI